jgi:hypothetical protein
MKPRRGYRLHLRDQQDICSACTRPCQVILSQCQRGSLADGMATDCASEKFAEYLQEVELVAHRIDENLEQG